MPRRRVRLNSVETIWGVTENHGVASSILALGTTPDPEVRGAARRPPVRMIHPAPGRARP